MNVDHVRGGTRDLSGAISGLFGIDPTAELNNPAHGAHFDFRAFHDRIFVESGLDPRCGLGVTAIFASRFLVTRYGASRRECRRQQP